VALGGTALLAPPQGPVWPVPPVSTPTQLLLPLASRVPLAAWAVPWGWRRARPAPLAPLPAPGPPRVHRVLWAATATPLQGHAPCVWQAGLGARLAWAPPSVRVRAQRPAGGTAPLAPLLPAAPRALLGPTVAPAATSHVPCGTLHGKLCPRFARALPHPPHCPAACRVCRCVSSSATWEGTVFCCA
jgi:hypothetical protein